MGCLCYNNPKLVFYAFSRSHCQDRNTTEYIQPLGFWWKFFSCWCSVDLFLKHLFKMFWFVKICELCIFPESPSKHWLLDNYLATAASQGPSNTSTLKWIGSIHVQLLPQPNLENLHEDCTPYKKVKCKVRKLSWDVFCWFGLPFKILTSSAEYRCQKAGR